jgi:rod shape-determining protein MreD
MSISRLSLSFLFLFFTFTIQEAAISRINFPITGFSLFLAILIGAMALENRSGAIILGFIGGLIMDLAPTSNSPFGQWALVLTLVGYVISSNRESIGDFTTRPVAFVFFVAFASALTLVLSLLLGSLIGDQSGTFGRNVVVVLGNTFWTFLFAPLVLPGLSKLRELTLTSRERA